MAESDESSEDDTLSYLAATGILPGLETIHLPRRSGSRAGKSANVARDFDTAVARLLSDYFDDAAKYGEDKFMRRFRMPRDVFDRFYKQLDGKGIFVRRKDGLDKRGIHPLQRIVAALRMLAYGVAADALDEYLQMSEDSVLLSVKAFCRLIVEQFGAECMREPTEQDLKRIMKINAARGFPGCIGSIDCQHWEWKNCPVAWAGQYKGKEKTPTVVLEAICDADLWICHAHFGSPGSCNDLNVLDTSATMQKIREGEFPPSLPYKINGTTRTMLYYLANGIYPNWAIFAKTIKDGTTPQKCAYSRAQEAFRKDIERAFGVLVARFNILQRPCRMWKRKDMAFVMKGCIILHNMVVEARRDLYDSCMNGLMHYGEAVAMFSNGQCFKWILWMLLENY